MRRFLPGIVFVLVALIGIGLTSVMYRAETTAFQGQFELSAEDAADRIREKFKQHYAYLTATHAFVISAPGNLSADRFKNYLSELSESDNFDGLQGIGFAPVVNIGEEPAIEAEILRNYGFERAIWPETSQDIRTPIVLLEPSDERNLSAIGFDMFSESRRRSAMLSAIETNSAQATAPVELAQEITEARQAGFLVYVPLKDAGPSPGYKGASGFIYMPFRAGDLHVAALKRTPALQVLVETHDITDGNEELLFRSEGYESVGPDRMSSTRELAVAGRTWRLTIRDAPGAYQHPLMTGTFALGVVSLLLAAALAALTYTQIGILDTSQSLREVTSKNLQEKDLMLQEMKHRIKNHLSRIIAISRQTAASADSLEDYSNSFSARLLAMSNAQDMLTRSHVERADLRQLLSHELQQVFGEDMHNVTMKGPEIKLGERATQALALTFHELATNAMKYGAVTEDQSSLSVKWAKKPRGNKRELRIEWRETSAGSTPEPTGKGFGTKLIDANIIGELDGKVTRDFHENGLVVEIVFPL